MITVMHATTMTARRPIDTYATWGAAYQIVDGLCSGNGFWYGSAISDGR